MSDNNNDILHVEGGKPLNGTIKVRGAKNFVSKAMVAALLAPGTSVLKNVPEIRDVHVSPTCCVCMAWTLRWMAITAWSRSTPRMCSLPMWPTWIAVWFVAYSDSVLRPAAAPFG